MKEIIVSENELLDLLAEQADKLSRMLRSGPGAGVTGENIRSIVERISLFASKVS